VFEPSEPNSINALIINEVWAKGAKRTHRYYPYYYQFVEDILRLVFGRNNCTGGRPIKDSGKAQRPRPTRLLRQDAGSGASAGWEQELRLESGGV